MVSRSTGVALDERRSAGCVSAAHSDGRLRGRVEENVKTKPGPHALDRALEDAATRKPGPRQNVNVPPTSIEGKK